MDRSPRRSSAWSVRLGGRADAVPRPAAAGARPPDPGARDGAEPDRRPGARRRRTRRSCTPTSAALPGLGLVVRARLRGRRRGLIGGDARLGVAAASACCRWCRSASRSASSTSGPGCCPPCVIRPSYLLVVVGVLRLLGGDAGRRRPGPRRGGACWSRSVSSGCCGGSTRAGMGFGDVRLSGVLGFALGYAGVGAAARRRLRGLPAGRGARRGRCRCCGWCDRKGPTRSGRSCWSARWSASSGAFPILSRLRRLSGSGLGGRPGRRTVTRARERLTPMLRWLTAGESHGPSLVAILEGLPAHVEVTTDDIADALARRRLGYGRGARMKFEEDEVDAHRRRPARPDPGRPGRDRDRQHRVAQVGAGDVGRPGRPGDPRRAGPQRAADPAAARARRPGRHAEVRLRRGPPGARAGLRPRDRGPGGARPGGDATSSSRPSARGSSPTWSRSAGSRRPPGSCPSPSDVARLDEDPVRCLDPDAGEAMVARIDQAHKDGDTLGGVVEVVVHGLPPGLGSHVHWDRRLDARLAGALMGIQAIKGVEVGDGFELAATPGSLAHDEIVPTDEGLRRTSGRSGGTEGGMTTGEIAAGPRRDEADRDRAARAAHRRRRDRRGGGRPPPALRRVRGAGRRASSPRRWSRSCWPTPCSRSSAATRSQETRRNVESYLDALRYQVSRAPRSRDPCGRARRPDGCRQDHGRPAARRRAGGCPSATPTTTSRPPRAGRSRRSSSTTARQHFRALERDGGRRGARDARRRPRARRRRRARPGDPGAAGRPPGGLPAGRAGRRREAGRARRRRGRCCSATSAPGSRRCSTSAPRSTSRSPRSSVDTDGRTPAGGRGRDVGRAGCRRMSDDDRHDPARRAAPSPYDVVVGRGLAGAAAGHARRRRAAGRVPLSRPALDERGRAGARRAARRTTTSLALGLPDGEAAKTAAVAVALLGGARRAPASPAPTRW